MLVPCYVTGKDSRLASHRSSQSVAPLHAQILLEFSNSPDDRAMIPYATLKKPAMLLNKLIYLFVINQTVSASESGEVKTYNMLLRCKMAKDWTKRAIVKCVHHRTDYQATFLLGTRNSCMKYTVTNKSSNMNIKV